MKKIALAMLVFGLALASVSLAAQAPTSYGGSPPPRILSQSVIDRFVTDLPALMKDFKALGDEYKAQAGAEGGGSPQSMANAFAAIRADERARAILTRHGWDTSFWQVYTTILFSYMATMMDQAYTQSPQPQMKQLGDQYRTMVNPADAQLVSLNSDRIQKLFESMKDE